ncbi:TPA: basic amino acid/polyamine antiporter [Salmonella enterica subsp. enterica]
MTSKISEQADNSGVPSSGHKLGLIALSAIVVSSMLGGGVFSLPQNTAATSAVGPVIIAWVIAGIGIYFIANSFRLLSNLRPDLKAGVYMYAQEGFGSFIGFNVAWGYWLMTAFGNVAFAVILMDTFDQFFPGVFTDGNNLNSILCGSVLIWAYNFLVLSGTKVAGFVNTVGTIAKLVPLLLFVLLLGIFINYSQLFKNFWGMAPQVVVVSANNHPEPVSLISQIFAPMTVTLWSFIGVEGAVVLSGRAKNKKDVGKATLLGFLLALIIYMLMSILPFGTMTQSELAQVSNPSTAGVLAHLIGPWGEWLMNIGLIISVLAGWLAWTMLCAEIPMVAGEQGAFPRAFARTNKKQAATVSLWISSLIMQAAMLLVYFSGNAWTTMYNISALMVVPAYITTTLYMAKICLNREYDQYMKQGRTLALISGLLGAIFCLFILYASQIQYVASVPLLLTCGLPLFVWSKKEKGAQQSILERKEYFYLAMLLLMDIIVIGLLVKGWISF